MESGRLRALGGGGYNEVVAAARAFLQEILVPLAKEQVMPRTLPLSAAQPSLSEIVAGMVPGEELVLTADGEPVAIVTRPSRMSWPCQPGTAKDRSFWMAPDFDAPLEDFAEYME
jgi:antitoxin (DNA-binding transcriptional repressor) of toxin-antitoxin stability system